MVSICALKLTVFYVIVCFLFFNWKLLEMESISLGKSKNIGVILISKNIFKALAKKPSAMKAIIVGGIAVIAVPTTIFGYATQTT